MDAIEQARIFKELLTLFSENQREVDNTNPMNLFFAEFEKDPAFLNALLDFSFEIISRMSVMNVKHKAKNIAEMVIASIPTTKRFYNEHKFIKKNDPEYRLGEIRRLNLQYNIALKMLLVILAVRGEATMTRKILEEADPEGLGYEYNATLDCITVRAFMPAKPYDTLEDRIARDEEFAKKHQEEFEKEALDAKKTEDKWKETLNNTARLDFIETPVREPKVVEAAPEECINMDEVMECGDNSMEEKNRA